MRSRRKLDLASRTCEDKGLEDWNCIYNYGGSDRTKEGGYGGSESIEGG